MICAAVDVTKLPEAAQAFGVSGVPAGVAVLAGRPAPIYTGPVSAEDLGDVLSQVLQLAAQYQLPGGFDPVVPEDEKPLPPCTQKPSLPSTAATWRVPAPHTARQLARTPAIRKRSSAWNRLNCSPE